MESWNAVSRVLEIADVIDLVDFRMDTSSPLRNPPVTFLLGGAYAYEKCRRGWRGVRSHRRRPDCYGMPWEGFEELKLACSPVLTIVKVLWLHPAAVKVSEEPGIRSDTT